MFIYPAVLIKYGREVKVKSLYQSGRLRGTMRLYGNGMMSKDCQESHETLQESRR